MASLRKYERSTKSLKQIELFSKSIDEKPSFNSILMNIRRIDEIKKEFTEVLVVITTLTEDEHEKFWSEIEDSHFRIKTILLNARDNRSKPTAITQNVNDLESSITAVLNRKRMFLNILIVLRLTINQFIVIVLMI